jgi:hypothetical protein
LSTQRLRVFTRYPTLPPKTVKEKWPIGASGMTGTVVCSLPFPPLGITVFVSARGSRLTWPSRTKASFGSPPVPETA